MAQRETLPSSRILVSVGDQKELSPLLTLGCAIAHAQQVGVTLLCVTADGTRPDWLIVPEQCGGVAVGVQVRAGKDPGKAILEAARDLDPILLLMGWSGEAGPRRYLLGSILDPVTRYAPCDVIVVRADGVGQVRRALVPVGGGPNATLALELALLLAGDVQVTALNIARDTPGPIGVAAGYEQLRGLLEPWADDPRVTPKVVSASNVIGGILSEAAAGYDIVLIGASNESYIDRQLFGNVPQTVAAESIAPTVIVKRRAGPVQSVLRQVERWFLALQEHLTISEQVETYRQVRRGARSQADFYVLISLAAAIATLGLLMNSPAVIIGAMVIAPLMSAIFGISMGIVQGDARLLWQAAGTMFRGAGLAVVIGAFLGWIVPLDAPTSEILVLTRPRLLDLVVALVSGTAGAYAQCRRSVSGAMAGVAIAVSLVPPLATAGIGVALGSLAIAVGALLLFLTNLSAITAVGSLTFLLFGFRPDPGKRVLVFGRSAIGVLALLLVVSALLTGLTVQSAREARLYHTLQESLASEIGEMSGVQMDDWNRISDDDEIIRLEVQVRANRSVSHQEAVDLQERVALRLRRPVKLALSIALVTYLDPSASLPADNPGR